jgi:hypothetical protein
MDEEKVSEKIILTEIGHSSLRMNQRTDISHRNNAEQLLRNSPFELGCVSQECPKGC